MLAFRLYQISTNYMEHPENYREPTLREKLEPYLFVLPLLSELLGLGFFIAGTYLSFNLDTHSRLTHTSPASVAWQGFILFSYSLMAVLATVMRSSKDTSKLHAFMRALLSTKYAIITLYIAQAAQIIAVIGFFFQPTCEWLGGILASVCCLVLWGLNFKTTMDWQVLIEKGFNLTKNESLICIGHSVGGQICRYHAKQLKYVMKAIFTIDSVPVMQYNMYGARNLNKTSTEELEIVYQENFGQDAFVKGSAFAWPLWLGSLLLGHILKQPDHFVPEQYSQWKDWQILTTKNWYAQALGFHDQVHSCDFNCSIKLVKDTPEDTLFCPVVAITADNKETTCTDKGIAEDSFQCQQDKAYKTAIMTLAEEMSGLGTKGGGVFYCGAGEIEVDKKVCRHDMAWRKIPFLMSVIEAKFKEWKLT
ncbi:hypothetical protein FGO68_gene1366 [Halteria grandinella]|uniref:Uncharacterized protein n=1 Tax=Halteria grandinella TaxID=5974 RepID=A0A8J8NTI2_HALGN|nr:hypothetical protein FGO68_gene1366 [Halteria grandinella]